MNEQALKDRIHAISKEKGIRFNECWKKLLLERFLHRLASSKRTDQFIFKGGYLLSYILDIGRETVDLDFLLTRILAGEDEIKKAVTEIASIPSMDGFIFTYQRIQPLQQPHMDYPGYRVDLSAHFGQMKDKIQIDVGVGDLVKPVQRQIDLLMHRGKPMFEEDISLLVYPTEAIFSEKLETIISKGIANSRMKDYHDLVLLIRNKRLIDPLKLKASLAHTFSHRGTHLRLIHFENSELQPLQNLWSAHLRNLGDKAKTLKLPQEISNVISEINQALDTLI